MKKDRLKLISDEEATEVSKLLLINSTSDLFNFTFEKITRQGYVAHHGVDAEESVNVYFNAAVKNEDYVKLGWKNKRIMIQLIERDRYHDYPYFNASYMEESDKVWKHHYLSNHIEAIEYLQKINLI